DDQDRARPVSVASAASKLPLIEAIGQSIARSIRSRTIMVVGDAQLANGLIVRILRRAGFTDIRAVEGSEAMKRIDALNDIRELPCTRIKIDKALVACVTQKRA